MNDSELKVLLYTDGSYQAFSAAVYTAILLKKIPNMNLTILQLQEEDDGSQGMEYSLTELRPKYKRYHWDCSTETNYSLVDTWPVNPDSKWIEHVLDKSEQENYSEILAKTNDIFSKRKQNVHSHKLCLNISFAETADTSEIVQTIVDYATTNLFDMVIIGTRGHSAINGLLFGSLSHDVLNQSPIPVLLIKKLPQEYIDSFLSDSES